MIKETTLLRHMTPEDGIQGRDTVKYKCSDALESIVYYKRNRGDKMKPIV